MILKDLKTIWGVPVLYFKECLRRHRCHLALFILIDALVILGGTALLYYLGESFASYGGYLISVCVILHFFWDYILKVENLEACKFYQKYSNCNVELKSYNLTDETLYSLLYCMGYKKVHQTKSADIYIVSMLNACCQDRRYARVLAKNMNKYESASGNISCYILSVGKKQYLVDFVSTIEKEKNNE